MNADPKTTFAKRLEQARKMRGLSLRALSQEVRGVVTYAALHKYEKAAMLPGSDVLVALAGALKQSADFFFRPLTVSLQKVEFRKRATMPVKQKEAVKEQARDFFERYREVEQLLGLDVDFENPLAGMVIRAPKDIETAAEKLRQKWLLGVSALPNVLELLEEHQVKVYDLEAPDKFDGLSGWAGELPVVVVNRRFPADRKRLTALHELGHLLLKFADQITKKERERLCHRFAGAVLMPKEVFLAEFGGNRDAVSWNELFELKRDFGISIAAIMARARNLGLITENYYISFNIALNTRGWRNPEPVEFPGQEQSNRFEQLLYRAASKELVSLSKAASLAGKPLAAFRDSLQLVP
jgi:Zn-dependent peptidase ImmA (M78 family)